MHLTYEHFWRSRLFATPRHHIADSIRICNRDLIALRRVSTEVISLEEKLIRNVFCAMTAAAFLIYFSLQFSFCHRMERKRFQNDGVNFCGARRYRFFWEVRQTVARPCRGNAERKKTNQLHFQIASAWQNQIFIAKCGANRTADKWNCNNNINHSTATVWHTWENEKSSLICSGPRDSSIENRDKIFKIDCMWFN